LDTIVKENEAEMAKIKNQKDMEITNLKARLEGN